MTTVTLNRLSRDDGAALVRQLIGNEAKIPAEVIDEILDRTDGVPLFLEEVTKGVLEAAGGDAAAARRIASAIPGVRLAVPATLQASLMARLDRLGPTAKEVTQIGAAIGREFSYELLIVVAQREEPEMRSALDRLVAAGLVFQRGVLPRADYRFKHSLVQDTAYGTLLRGPRRALHLRIAAGLEEKFVEIVQSQPETVAYHLTEAGLHEKAATYWLKAGRNSAARSANLEAIAHLRRGIDAIRGFAEGSTKDRLELDFQVALGTCLIATQGPVSGASLETFARARELCERLANAPEYLQVMFWLGNVRFVRGEMPECLEACEAGLALAEARGDRTALLNWRRGLAMILLFMGRVAEARDQGEQALIAFDASDEIERGIARAAGQDAGAAGLAVSSLALWALGYADTALARTAAALDRADAIEHPHTQAYVCYYASILHVLRGDAAFAQRQAARCLALSEQHSFRQWLGPSRIVRDICASLLDEAHGAIDDAQRELGEYRRTGSQVGVPLLCAISARLWWRGSASARYSMSSPTESRRWIEPASVSSKRNCIGLRPARCSPAVGPTPKGMPRPHYNWR